MERSRCREKGGIRKGDGSFDEEEGCGRMQRSGCKLYRWRSAGGNDTILPISLY